MPGGTQLCGAHFSPQEQGSAGSAGTGAGRMPKLTGRRALVAARKARNASRLSDISLCWWTLFFFNDATYR
jgi:hypothetical protein